MVDDSYKFVLNLKQNSECPMIQFDESISKVSAHPTTIYLQLETLKKLFDSSLSPQAAYLKGLLRIKGDLINAQHLETFIRALNAK